MGYSELEREIQQQYGVDLTVERDAAAEDDQPKDDSAVLAELGCTRG